MKVDIDKINVLEDDEGGVILHFEDKKIVEQLIPHIEKMFNATLEEVPPKKASRKQEKNNSANPYAYYRYGNNRYLGNHVQQVGKYTDNKPYSIMHVFGLGDSEDTMINAGRIIKGKRDFIIEIKVDNKLYCGLQLRGNYGEGNSLNGVPELYTSNYSKVQAVIDNDNADIPVSHDTDVYTSKAGCGE